MMEVEKSGGVLFRIDRFDSGESKLSCCFCFGASNLRDLTTTYYYDGKPEVYNQMIQDCFGIKLLRDTLRDKSCYLICDLCVTRLREAYFFRMIVEIARAAIQQKDSIKIENPDDYDSLTNNPYTYNIQILCDPPDHSSGNNSGNERISAEIASKTAMWKKPIEWTRPMSEEGDDIPDQTLNTESEDDDDDVPLDKVKKIHKNQRKGILKAKYKTAAKKYKKMKDIKERVRKLKLKRKKMSLTQNLGSSYNSENRCKICDETFPLLSGLVKHMATHSADHICDICARCFTSKSNLQSHLARHKQTTELLPCPICKRTYRGKMNLKKHLRIHKSPHDIYKCPHCNERFSNYYRRMQHLVEFHDDEAKKYKCKHCPKRYCQATTLTRHVKVVHLQERRYSCEICGMTFFDRTGLKGHMIKHTGIKMFRCEVCNKAYARRFTLNEHMKIHDNVKEFVCPICDRPFTQKCTLKTHMKVHQKKQVETQYSEDM